jgi:hypothetical protein
MMANHIKTWDIGFLESLFGKGDLAGFSTGYYKIPPAPLYKMGVKKLWF